MPAPETPSVVDVLTRARGFVERGWTQKAVARDRGGKATRASKAAACFCAIGGIMAASGGSLCMLRRAANALAEATGANFPVDWNDAEGRTQAEVLAAFDKAIALVSAEAV